MSRNKFQKKSDDFGHRIINRKICDFGFFAICTFITFGEIFEENLISVSFHFSNLYFSLNTQPENFFLQQNNNKIGNMNAVIVTKLHE